MCFKGVWCCLCCKCRRSQSFITQEQESEGERRRLLNGQEAVVESVGPEQGNVTEAVSQAINEPRHATEANSTGYVCQPDERTDSFNECSPDNIPKFNAILKGKIKDIICAYIRSPNLLHLFHKYNVMVLSERDIVEIKKTMKRRGHYEGADVLLERLVAYDGWFQCLIQVMKDPATKLHRAAEELQKIRDTLIITYPAYIKQTENESAGQSEATEAQVNIFKEIIAEVRQNNKTLLEGIIQLNTTNDDLDKLVKSLKIQLEQVSDRNGQSASLLQVCQEEITQLKLEKEYIKKENTKYQDELGQLASQLKVCQENIAQLKLEKGLEIIANENKNDQDDLGQSASQLQVCQEEITQLKLKKGQLALQWQVCQEEIAQLKVEKERIEKENKNHQDDLELNCDECKQKRKIKLNQRWISSL
ncbi:hypothetical protein BgiBS90_021031, partial [Biomphalaria glabrata]